MAILTSRGVHACVAVVVALGSQRCVLRQVGLHLRDVAVRGGDPDVIVVCHCERRHRLSEMLAFQRATKTTTRDD